MNITKEQLYDEFIVNKLTVKQIAFKYNLKHYYVKNELKKHGIKKARKLDNILNLSKEELEELYINRKMSLSEIAIYVGYGRHQQSAVRKLLDAYGIPARELDNPSKRISKEVLINEYVVLQKSITQIAIENNVKSHNSIFNLLCKFNIPVINKSDRDYIRGKDNEKYLGYEDISMTFWGAIIKGARCRNIEFGITIEYGWELFLKQNKKCALSGVELTFPPGSRREHAIRTASLDRIDSSKGYIEGNVQWVHKHVNIIKWALRQQLFIEWCHKVSDYQRSLNCIPST